MEGDQAPPQETVEIQAVTEDQEIIYRTYRNEHDMKGIIGLIENDLSEPYSIFTYRYFINNWPQLCILAEVGERCIGVIVSKLDMHRGATMTSRGYIAMLAVDKDFRKAGIGSDLVQRTLDAMRAESADECVLEAEVKNKAALGLYRNMGFVRHKRLQKYYLSGVDALRLKYLFDASLGQVDEDEDYDQ
eukprot:GEMP01097445.1.p1 GENE.GEMP01097445.1~~GEMP01097445.1.p1  ORF type:complete len:196 (-),score=28.86 GEMP01097445.1:252-818(-)